MVRNVRLYTSGYIETRHFEVASKLLFWSLGKNQRKNEKTKNVEIIDAQVTIVMIPHLNKFEFNFLNSESVFLSFLKSSLLVSRSIPLFFT